MLRYHTWPVIRQQSIGEHTWQCLRLYREVWGPLPTAVADYLLYHDAGELVVGDPPFPLKAQNPELKEIYDGLEKKALAGMGGALPPLYPEEKLRVKFVDLLEMFEFGLTEMEMGNRLAEPIVVGTKDALCHQLERMPLQDSAVGAAYVRKVEEFYGKCTFLK